MFRVHAIYSADADSFSVKFVFKKNGKKQKESGERPIKNMLKFSACRIGPSSFLRRGDAFDNGNMNLIISEKAVAICGDIRAQDLGINFPYGRQLC